MPVVKVGELQTFPLKESLAFFKELNNKQLTGRNSDHGGVDLKIDLKSLEQIELTNTTAKLNIANTTTNLEGEVLGSFKIDMEIVFGVYDLTKASAIDSILLWEVIVHGYVKAVLFVTNDPYPRMNYQYVRSQNNCSTIEIAYYACIAKKIAKKIDDEINTDKLPSCLGKILNDLKRLPVRIIDN